ncbi:MAG: rod shape-determining protein MreC [Bacteroidia bacterium]
MLPLLRFLQKRKNLLLFLLLEGIALFLVVRYSNPHRQTFGDAMLGLNIKLHRSIQGVTQYTHLDESNQQLQLENDSLRKEVLRLRNITYLERLEYASRPNWRRDTAELDSIEQIDYLPCRAIQFTTHRPYNYITLDKGRADGVEENMGLLSPQGVAGRVVKVGEDFSVALSALNAAFKQAVRTQQGYAGAVFEWRGGDISKGYIMGVPINVPIKVGEQVYTAAHSTVFPENFPIGTVSAVEPDSKAPGFHAVEITMATDFTTIDNLYLIQVPFREAVDSLQQGLIQ